MTIRAATRGGILRGCHISFQDPTPACPVPPKVEWTTGRCRSRQLQIGKRWPTREVLCAQNGRFGPPCWAKVPDSDDTAEWIRQHCAALIAIDPVKPTKIGLSAVSFVALRLPVGGIINSSSRAVVKTQDKEDSMKYVFPPAIVLVCTCALQAQIIGKVNRLADGSEQVRIQNNAKKALIAFALSVKQVAPDTAPDRDSLSGPLVIISDPLIDATAGSA